MACESFEEKMVDAIIDKTSNETSYKIGQIISPKEKCKITTKKAKTQQCDPKLSVKEDKVSFWNYFQTDFFGRTLLLSILL